MKLVLISIAVMCIFELAIWLPGIWHIRRVMCAIGMLGVLGSTTALFVVHPRVWSALFAILGMYRVFNLYRVLKARMHERYLHQVTRRSSAWLIIEQAAILLVLKAITASGLSSITRWQILASIELLLVSILLVSLLRHLHSTREPITARAYADRDLPTLTVAIPARNETDELESCLHSILANTYPKLEILVLDDCSANARTPEIIRSFAHDGVRFIAGREPEHTWLAKNLAYERLREEANGELILFCGVDTRFAPDGLRHLVENVLERQKNMVSILPTNTSPALAVMLVQPARYAWELALPRRLFQRPAVLSTCWLAKKSFLDNAGGFRAVSRSIVPESYFARQAAAQDAYGFYRSDAVKSQKSYMEQRSTAIRTRYPQLHRRPEQVALLALCELFGLVGPYVLFISSILEHLWLTAWLSGASSALFMVVYALTAKVTYRRFIAYSLLLAPLAAIYDALILNYSMIKYELRDVIWKGRNVCIPVMHVVSTLPKLT